MPTNDNILETRFLRFRKFEREGKKTWVVHVESRSSGSLLGVIQWYGAWRQYVFYPEPKKLFNPTCMDEITAVTRAQSREQRRRRVKT